MDFPTIVTHSLYFIVQPRRCCSHSAYWIMIPSRFLLTNTSPSSALNTDNTSALLP